MDDGQLLLTWRAGFLRTFREQKPECCPFTWPVSRISGVAISSGSIAPPAITWRC